MSLNETMDVLRGYENFLDAHGADVVRRLRPGLSRQRIDDLCKMHRVTLPEDAYALWMWHDGDAAGPWQDNGWTGKAGIVAWFSFPSLESTLTMLEEECPDPDDILILPGDDENVRIRKRNMIPIAYYCYGPRLSVMEWPPEHQCVVFPGGGKNGADALLRGQYWPLPEFIHMCEQCIESGLWRIYPDGQIRNDRRWQMRIYQERVRRNGGKPLNDPAYYANLPEEHLSFDDMLEIVKTLREEGREQRNRDIASLSSDETGDSMQKRDQHGI